MERAAAVTVASAEMVAVAALMAKAGVTVVSAEMVGNHKQVSRLAQSTHPRYRLLNAKSAKWAPHISPLFYLKNATYR